MSSNLLHLLKIRYTQLGGLRLMREYSRMGLLWPAAKRVFRHPFSRQTYKQVYLDTARKVGPMLIEEYKPVMGNQAADLRAKTLEHKRNKTIWFCWLQGLENAPEVVKVCHKSLTFYLGGIGYSIVVIDENNWREYIDLPDYIISRREKRQIPPAHFADLLRLELLVKYGGTWIDSTVLCTGEAPQGMPISYYLDTDLFMFQYTQPGSDKWGGIGNWFISACTNNEVLIVLREMLYAYWKDHDCVLSYYLFHQFFDMLREVYPERIAEMPYAFAPRSLALVKHWGERFVEAKWNRLTERVSFHKLTYLEDKVPAKVDGTYYQFVMNTFMAG